MKWNRSKTGNLQILDVYECPIEVLEEVARAAGVGATVENVQPVRVIDEWYDSIQSIGPGEPAGPYLIRNATFDVALKNSDFLSLKELWNTNGVYAVFTERSPIAFQASSIEGQGRYKALGNFGFVLEFCLAGPSSSGWSQLVSPQESLIDLAETVLGRS